MAVIIKLSKNALIAQNITNKAVNICQGHNVIDFETGSILWMKKLHYTSGFLHVSTILISGLKTL